MPTTLPTQPPRLHWPFGIMIFATVLAGVLIAILMWQGSRPGNQAPAPTKQGALSLPVDRGPG